MTLPEDMAELVKQLDPATRAVFSILQSTIEELTINNKELAASNKALTGEVSKLTAQVAKFQKMLFGRKSEKLPPMQSEVRRVIEEEELFGQGEGSPESVDKPTDRDREKARRKRGRANSEKKRKKNRQLKKNLPVVKERVLVSVGDLPEGYTLDDFREVGSNGEAKNIIRRVEHVREHLVVVEYRNRTTGHQLHEIN